MEKKFNFHPYSNPRMEILAEKDVEGIRLVVGRNTRVGNLCGYAIFPSSRLPRKFKRRKTLNFEDISFYPGINYAEKEKEEGRIYFVAGFDYGHYGMMSFDSSPAFPCGKPIPPYGNPAYALEKAEETMKKIKEA